MRDQKIQAKVRLQPKNLVYIVTSPIPEKNSYSGLEGLIFLSKCYYSPEVKKYKFLISDSKEKLLPYREQNENFQPEVVIVS